MHLNLGGGSSVTRAMENSDCVCGNHRSDDSHLTEWHVSYSERECVTVSLQSWLQPWNAWVGESADIPSAEMGPLV